MPFIALHPPSSKSFPSITKDPLPHLLQTPSGLAIVEIQGTLQVPPSEPQERLDGTSNVDSGYTRVGKLVFPLLGKQDDTSEDHGWMKQVYFYIGNYQRMTGMVKKLEKPLGVMRKKRFNSEFLPGEISNSEGENLEIVEIIKYKIVFSQRPEPVGVEE